MSKDLDKYFMTIQYYQYWSFMIMSLIVSYHIVGPESIGSYILTLVLFFPILSISYFIVERTMWLK